MTRFQSTRHPRRRFAFEVNPWGLLAVVLALAATPGSALAGGGPENVLLVVNQRDAGSKTIANYYADLRAIPPSNVVYLDWKLGDQFINVNQFRNDLMTPIIQQMEARQISSQIDYIVYSSGFPWGINFKADVPENLQTTSHFKHPTASLNGLTYLMYGVMAKNATEYARLNANRYMRLREMRDGGLYELPVEPSGQLLKAYRLLRDEDDQDVDPTSIGSHGFRSWYGWGSKGELLESGGSRYVLSAVLGVTNGRGNTVSEIVSYLRRSQKADGTHPPGTIYFMDNTDIRAKTRSPGFSMAVEQLRQLNVKAKIGYGDLPRAAPDVQGLLTGVKDFDWRASGSAILPGAICEHLTSFGGDLRAKRPQTPCTEFLKYGAAGTSGTVTEPYALQSKFPHAMIQVHYARGCTLAEAYYQAVFGPYQLLILGDPLCQPWANIPVLAVEGVTKDSTLKGVVTLRPTAELPRGGECDRFELFLDGLRITSCMAGDVLQLDTAKYADGYHELRVVGFERSPIETQGAAIIPVQFDNRGQTIEISATPDRLVRAGRPVKLTANCPGAVGVAFYHNRRLVATVQGEQGTAEVDSLSLGDGPVTLTATAWSPKGQELAFATPIKLMVQSGAGG